MKVLCLGGGPAGLYFAISMKLRDPSHQVTVLERNRANDTFGWGVVLSDDALGRMQKNDPGQHRCDPVISPIGTISPWCMTACAPCRAGTALRASGASRC
jgi:2-polyprenyl-6-methoxyphenol hydroxylase-like FAD-dependent oxidoreductase